MQQLEKNLQGREFCLLPLNFGCNRVELGLEFGSVAKLERVRLNHTKKKNNGENLRSIGVGLDHELKRSHLLRPLPNLNLQ